MEFSFSRALTDDFYSIFHQNDPELAQALLGNDLNRLQDILRQRRQQKFKMQRRQEEELVSYILLLNPWDTLVTCLACVGIT